MNIHVEPFRLTTSRLVKFALSSSKTPQIVQILYTFALYIAKSIKTIRKYLLSASTGS